MKNLNKNLKDNLTIIIPTYNRAQLLYRSLSYYSKWNCRILIADSSDVINTRIIDFKNSEYLYLKHHQFSNKIEYCLKLVKTRFVCISCDDDFFSYNGMIKAIEFLQNNTDYVAVHGRYSQFRLENNVVYSYKQLPNKDCSIKDEKVLNRILNSASIGLNPISMLYKKDILSNSLKICSDLPEMIEYTLNIIPLLYGKRAMLPVFWMARDVGKFTDYSIFKYGENIEERHFYKISLSNKIINTEIGRRYFNSILNLLDIQNKKNVDNISLLKKIFFEIYFPTNLVEKSIFNSYKRHFNIFIKMLLPNFMLFYYRGFVNNKSFSNKKSENEDWEIIRNKILQHGRIDTI